MVPAVPPPNTSNRFIAVLPSWPLVRPLLRRYVRRAATIRAEPPVVRRPFGTPTRDPWRGMWRGPPRDVAYALWWVTPAAGATTKQLGGSKPEAANALVTAFVTVCSAAASMSASTQPPKPPPIIRAPYAPAARAASTAV